MSNSVIVIPIHKNLVQLTNSERKSLTRTLEVFADKDVFLLISESIDRKEYNSVYSQHLKYIIISEAHFKDIDSYSKLLMSSFFYSLFKKYTWMLICQLDAFVFKNDLISFTVRNDFFYVGAPIIGANLKDWNNISWVGNGGLSLRRIDKCLKVTNKLEALKKLIWVLGKNLTKGRGFIFSSFRFLIGKSFSINYNKYLTRYLIDVQVNEDVFWSLWVPTIFSDLKPADINTATRFSFEVSPEKIYKSVCRLPMGCHAWEKYNPDFWRNHIQ